jgi:hypothetical protein
MPHLKGRGGVGVAVDMQPPKRNGAGHSPTSDAFAAIPQGTPYLCLAQVRILACLPEITVSYFSEPRGMKMPTTPSRALLVKGLPARTPSFSEEPLDQSPATLAAKSTVSGR